MAESNCPMCGNPNPEQAEVCAHCGARLTPVTGGQASSDWLSEIRDQAEGTGSTGGTSPFASFEQDDPDAEQAEPEGDDRLAEGQVPDWLRRVRQKQAAEQGQPEDDRGTLQDDSSDEIVEDQQAVRPRPEPHDPRAGFPGLSVRPGDLGDQPEDPRAGFDFGDEDAAADPQAAAQFERQRPPAEPEKGVPGWLQEREEDSQPAPAEPSPADPESEGGLPHVQALIGDEGSGLDAEELGLPKWLGEIEPTDDEQPERPGREAAPGLERATLPNWLEAMRPVDTFRSVVQIDAEEDQAVESVGPLAGLRGVLLAEPVVAMPRSSTTGAMQLEVSERQYAQAELLHRMITEEEGSQPAAPRRRRRLSLIRWGIAALTVLAAALPILTGSPSFALPALEPQELGPLFEIVGRLPPDQPALFVFDYEPGNAGELEAVAGPLLDQVMARGLPVASVSTRPTGSPLAARAAERYAIRHGYVTGRDLVHLGYLSGGPAAVQLFSLNPRGAVLKGFGLPSSMTEAGEGAWDSPALANVAALSDFGMVAVITAGSETARLWVEQARPLMGDTPLVMVLSAGAEPLVRPYYEASRPQIDGILTGLPAAVAYEQRNGRFGGALQHWNSFGAGMLAAELVLVAGTGYGVLRWGLARREG